MTRSRATAKKAGSSFERLVADYLRDVVDDRIDRRAKTGAKDRGDIGGLRHMTQRVVIEAKDYGGQIKASEWVREAEVERGNDDAGVGIVVAKRRGTSNPADQFVLMTLGELVSLVNGNRDHLDDSEVAA